MLKYVIRSLQVFDKINQIFAAIASGIFLFITLLVTFDVFLRYIFKTTLTWSVEISEYSLLYITFLGTTWVLTQGAHVKVDFLFIRLKPKAQALISAILSVLCAFVFLIVFRYGIEVVWVHLERKIYLMSVLNIPYGYILLIIPIGSLLLFIQFVRMSCEYIKMVIFSPADNIQVANSERDYVASHETL